MQCDIRLLKVVLMLHIANHCKPSSLIGHPMAAHFSRGVAHLQCFTLQILSVPLRRKHGIAPLDVCVVGHLDADWPNAKKDPSGKRAMYASKFCNSQSDKNADQVPMYLSRTCSAGWPPSRFTSSDAKHSRRIAFNIPSR